MDHNQNLNYYESVDKLQQQQNYFLAYESYFWMASTYDFKLTNNPPTIYKECSTCKNKMDRFSIPLNSN